MSAGPVLRAGFTEVLVTGMLTRWIRVSASPIAIGAKPCGARSSVEPTMTSRKPSVSTTSIRNPEPSLYPPGEPAPKPFCARPRIGQAEGRVALGDQQQHERPQQRPGDLRDHVRDDVARGKRPAAHSPKVTAGLRWQPDTWPIA